MNRMDRISRFSQLCFLLTLSFKVSSYIWSKTEELCYSLAGDSCMQLKCQNQVQNSIFWPFIVTAPSPIRLRSTCVFFLTRGSLFERFGGSVLYRWQHHRFLAIKWEMNLCINSHWSHLLKYSAPFFILHPSSFPSPFSIPILTFAPVCSYIIYHVNRGEAK